MHFPMYVLKVSDFLEMRGVPEAHGALLSKGLLHEWREGMFVAFVSHMWLGLEHPDPLGEHMQLLQQVLRDVVIGRLAVELPGSRDEVVSFTLTRLAYSCVRVYSLYVVIKFFYFPVIYTSIAYLDYLKQVDFTLLMDPY